jgi:hypothetical protein
MGGAGGDGGSTGIVETFAFDFENGTDGFKSDNPGDVTLAVSSDRAVHGTQSLKVTLPALKDANRKIIAPTAFWPGTELTFRVWVPADADALWMQAYSMIDFYNWDQLAPAAIVRGGWTTWTYVVPKSFPGGMQEIGLQIGGGPEGFAGGDVYIDAIAVVPGVVACSGASVTRTENASEAKSFDFEGTSSEPWAEASGASDVALAVSSDEASAGTQSMKVSLTALAAGGKRSVQVGGPNAFCGEHVTFNVYVPADAADLSFQVFAQYNNWTQWTSAQPAPIKRGEFTRVVLPLPDFSSTPALDAGGIQSIGVQFTNEGTSALDANFYIDDVRIE